MKAKTPRGRLRQVERWLAANFPTALPVRVVARDLSDGKLGLTSRQRDSFVICIHRSILGAGLLDCEVLLHEHAHAGSWRPHLEGDVFEIHHDDEWAIAYGKRYRAYFDEGGDVDAEEFSARPWS